MTPGDGSSQGSAEALLGHLATYGELLGLLAGHPGLVVIESAPLSGTSALLGEVTAALAGEVTIVLCDARGCADTHDLAMAIGDATVKALAPEAESWWLGDAGPMTAEGMRLLRTVGGRGIDLQELRGGSGPARRLLADALALLVELAPRPMLIVDHLGLLLAGLGPDGRRELLAEMRAARQREAALDLVLVEHLGGRIGNALRNPEHPLYQGGQKVSIGRPKPAAIAGDLAVGRVWTPVDAAHLRTAAELASGVPALTWAALDLTEPGETPLAGWQRLRATSEPGTARNWDLLRQIHRQAQPIVAAISVGQGPHSIPANSKSVNDALLRLRDLGQLWQPGQRRWSVADPLLRAWVRDNAPPWARHRT